MTKRRSFLSAVAGFALAPFGMRPQTNESQEIDLHPSHSSKPAKVWVCDIFKGDRRHHVYTFLWEDLPLDQMLDHLFRITGTSDRTNVWAVALMDATIWWWEAEFVRREKTGEPHWAGWPDIHILEVLYMCEPIRDDGLYCGCATLTDILSKDLPETEGEKVLSVKHGYRQSARQEYSFIPPRNSKSLYEALAGL